VQNSGTSASNIADIARKILEETSGSPVFVINKEKTYTHKLMQKLKSKRRLARIKH